MSNDQTVSGTHKAALGGPLSGLRVLDFTRVLSGPFCTMVLGDLGAEIIKIERPGKGDESRYGGPKAGGESTHFMTANRNKQSVALDLQTPEGRRVALELAKKCDIAIDNFRPGVMGRLGLDYKALQSVNPKMIVCSISGFGMTGPMRDRAAFDVIAQALTGAMSVTGEPGGSTVRMGVPMGDIAAGLFAVISILAAVRERDTTGRGSAIDIGMYDSMLSLMHYFVTDYILTGKEPGPVGSGNPSIFPYGAFKAKDGDLIIAAFQTSFWRKLCDALELPDLASDKRFYTNDQRVAGRDELTGIINAVLAKRTREEWSQVLDAADIPNASVMSVGEVVAHPHTAAREMVEEVQHPTAGLLRMTGRPIKFLDRQRAPQKPSPLLGEHTVSILRDLLGYGEADIQALVSAGATKLGTAQSET